MWFKKAKENERLTIVQEPSCAEADIMPWSAINTENVDYILCIKDIVVLLNKILGEKHIC
ncbi:MAG: chemotaxis protein CheB [Bacillota bacterium]|nr:chemotaxis protein CheB [Bacillota bacterium]